MSIAEPSRLVAGAASGESLPLRRVVAVSTVAAGVLCVLQSFAAYTGIVRRGGDASLFSLLLGNSLYYVPWVVYSTILFWLVDRRRERLGDPLFAGKLLVASAIFFFAPYVVYEVAVEILNDGRSFAELLPGLRHFPPFILFVDFVLFSGCFAVVYAVGMVRGQLLRERARQALESQMLSLRLELEKQRLASIHAQLEPHFLFNALNAISALVRTEDRSTAVSALTRLSGLLRYALTASRLDRVTLREELAFVRDYLDLQKLRYGARLVVDFEIDDESVEEISCPPLLLQPLVENALRHDLDAHDGPSDLDIRVFREGTAAVIRISNPLRPEAAPNAGFGLGLGATRERLSLLYGGTATFDAGENDGRFVAELRLPEADDA